MPSKDEWRLFAAWAAIGAASMWSTWTLLRLGWILLLVAIAAALRLASTTEPGRTGWGFVAGLGAVPLWIGWANRGADQPLSPAWWIVGGGVTVAMAVLAFLRPRRAAPVDAAATDVEPHDRG
jgi:hypothetical protein